MPPNHALFTSQTEADLQLEIYEDAVERQESLREALEHFDATAGTGPAADKARTALLADLNAVNGALGDPIVEEDPLVARWERELAEGKMPNLRDRRER